MASGPTSDRVRVFLSSRFIAMYEHRQHAQTVIRELGYEPVLCPEGAVAGEPNAEYLRRLRGSDVVVVLIDEESDAVERERSLARRDGKPTVELVAATVPDSLHGRTFTDFARGQVAGRRDFVGHYSTLAELSDGIRDGLVRVAAEAIRSGARIRSLGDDTWREISENVELAVERLAIVQDTSTLFLGPRKDRFNEEALALELMQRRLEGVANGRDDRLTIVHLFDSERTLRELAIRPDQFPAAEAALAWLEEMVEIASGNENIKIGATNERVTACVLHDQNLSSVTWMKSQLWREERDVGETNAALWAKVLNLALDAKPINSLISQAGAILQSAHDGSSVMLLSNSGRKLGPHPKIDAHRFPGLLHLAISVVLFNERGQVLLQQRSPAKYHFAGQWANACCTHPPSDEGLSEFGAQRLKEELGLTQSVQLARAGEYTYAAVDHHSGLVERERTVILAGTIPESTLFDPPESEVATTRWCSIDELRRDAADTIDNYTPWALPVIERAVAWRDSRS